MRLLKNESIKRGVSVVTLYAMFVQQIVPFGWANASESVATFGYANSNEKMERSEEIRSDIESIDHVEMVPEQLSTVAVTSSGGGAQVESTGYSLQSTDDLVNKFTGDFGYNIPLMDVEGYPISISYNSNVQMETEASWVGLGWDLGIGAISRELRGIPDEFNGDQDIVREYKKKSSSTDGWKAGAYAGIDYGDKESKVVPGVGVSIIGGEYQSQAYGLGRTLDLSLSPSVSFSFVSDDKGWKVTPDYNVGISYDSKNGITTSQSVGVTGSYAFNKKNSVQPRITYGKSWNTRIGTASKAFGFEMKYSRIKKHHVDWIMQDDKHKHFVSADPSLEIRSGSYGSTGSSGYGQNSENGNGSGYGSNLELWHIPQSEDELLQEPSQIYVGGPMYLKRYKYYSKSGLKAGFGTSMKLSYGTTTGKTSVPLESFTEGSQFTTDVFVKFKVAPKLSMVTGVKYQDYDNDASTVEGGPQTIEQKAFGYFHSGKTESEENKPAIMDFDRGTNFMYSKKMKNLDFSVQSYDVFYATGAGMAGAFRGRRTDYGTYYVDRITDETQVGNGGVKAGFEIDKKTPPGSVVLGGDGGKNTGIETTGPIASVIDFDQSVSKGSAEFDAPVYFKAIGEPTPEDLGVYNLLEGDKPLYVQMQESNKDIVTNAVLLGGSSPIDLNSNNPNNVNHQLTISNHFEPVLAQDLTAGNDSYEVYRLNDFDYTNNNVSVQRIDQDRIASHISKVDVTNNAGTKYVYGIPAYSLSSSEILFSAKGLTKNATEDLIRYDPLAGHNSTSNNLGSFGLYDRTTVPDYANSFLLTELLGPDYIDVTGDGPSIDDIGTWYKFNHTQVYGLDEVETTGANEAYNWRFPVSGNGNEAVYIPGYQGTKDDDLASYTYGEKEIWYAHSIESKNMIAEFHVSPREDAYAVLGENGGLDLDKPLYKLDKIVLYNRSEKLNNPNADPIQTVEFEYDYSLCKNAPSNKHTYAPNIDYDVSGKLTLRKIRIYNGTSQEAGLSAYEFDYSSVDRDFELSNIDAWGNFKQGTLLEQNKFFPYAEQQDETQINEDIQAWKLTTIKMPEGGELKVDYEADRYAYVQDKKAMRQFNIETMTNVFEFMNMMENELYNPAKTTLDYNWHYNSAALTALGGTQFKDKVMDDELSTFFEKSFGRFDRKRIPNNVIIFKLDKKIASDSTQTAASDYVSKAYFADVKDPKRAIYFKIQTEVNRDGETTNYDYIPVYGEIAYNGNNVLDNTTDGTYFEDSYKAVGAMPPLTIGGDYEYGYVILRPATVGEKAKKDDIKLEEKYVVHPFQKAAIEYARINLAKEIHGDPFLRSAIDKNMRGKRDVNRVMMEMEYAERMTQPMSVVRLYEPDKVKFGGNARVSKITYKDNWDVMSQEYGTEYFWTYKYGDKGKESGVASWEPSGIMDENPHYKWSSYTKFNDQYADEREIDPKPLGAALYPTPVVGYGTVQVFFSDQYYRGYSETKYYTAKDFPTKEKDTKIIKMEDIKRRNPIDNRDLYGFSQGFSVTTNDFHGKILSETIYNDQGSVTATGNIVEKKVYKYYGLDEKQTVIDPDGKISKKALGLEYDFHAESNSYRNSTEYWSIGLEVKWTPPLLFIISPKFKYGKGLKGFHSNTFVKHISKTAILKEIEMNYLGAKNSIETMAYDSKTGAPIVSSMKDEYGDKLYSVVTPAHWYYDQYRGTEEVEDLAFTGTLTTNVLSVSGAAAGLLTEGDFLELTHSGTPYQVWVLEIDANGDAILINNIGESFDQLSGAVSVRMIESGRENVLMAAMQSVETKKEVPLVSGTDFQVPTEEILASNVITLRDRNSVKCHPEKEQGVQVQEGARANPFLVGAKGKLVADGAYLWRSGRVQATDAQSSNHGTRFDGYYETFEPMFQLNTTDKTWYRIDNPSYPGPYDLLNPLKKWRKQGEFSMFDEYGRPIETTDQIRMSSAVLYGYNHELGLAPVAEAVNAAKQDIAFDGFEDYDYYSNVGLGIQERHFDFRNVLSQVVQITQEDRHSGLSSLRLSEGSQAMVTRRTGDDCGGGSNGISEGGEFEAESCLCIPPFEPRSGEYIISAWVKVANSNLTSYLGQASIEIDLGGTNIATFPTSGPIIDGWQRIEGKFNFTSGPNVSFAVRLRNNTIGDVVYFDDIRIHPFTASMTTTVYDPSTMLPIASHDEYNYTTFYNYDENLNQVRMRVETIEGVQTISEIETGGKKVFKTE